MKTWGKAEARERQEQTRNKGAGSWWLCSWWCPTMLRTQNSYREAAHVSDTLIWLTERLGWGTCRSSRRAQQGKSQHTSSGSYQVTSRGRGIPLIETLVERKRPGNALLHCSKMLQLLAKDFIAYFLYQSLLQPGNQLVSSILRKKRQGFVFSSYF